MLVTAKTRFSGAVFRRSCFCYKFIIHIAVYGCCIARCYLLADEQETTSMIYDDDAVVEQQGAEQSNASGIDANKLDLSGNLVWGNPWPERFVWSPLSPDNKFVGRRWLSEMSSTGPKLTLEGRSIKTVMFASMLGGTCESDDWRGDLPRHLMKFLPKATGVLLYARDSKYLDCKICSSIGVTTKQNCQQLLGTGKNTQKADLLVVIGTGRLSACNDNNTNRAECSEDSNEHYPSLDNLLSHTSYTHNKTLTVHIPVRKLRSLFNNQVFNFRHVIQDYDFMKPIAMETCREMARYCQHTKKAKRLLYVGRYVEKKGQVEFLSRVDPAQLKGFTVAFYGGGFEENTTIPGTLRAIARRRGISVDVNTQRVQHNTLLHAYCQSMGQVHYASGDNNPRAAYEGLYAGNPLFVSTSSRLPSRVYEQRFVVGLPFGAPQTEFDGAFEEFMTLVRSNRTQHEVHYWVEKNLQPASIYTEVCRQIGICQQ